MENNIETRTQEKNNYSARSIEIKARGIDYHIERLELILKLSNIEILKQHRLEIDKFTDDYYNKFRDHPKYDADLLSKVIKKLSIN